MLSNQSHVNKRHKSMCQDCLRDAEGGLVEANVVVFNAYTCVSRPADVSCSVDVAFIKLHYLIETI